MRKIAKIWDFPPNSFIKICKDPAGQQKPTAYKDALLCSFLGLSPPKHSRTYS